MALENLVEMIAAEARALQDTLVADRRRLHQIPEVGMDVPETAAYVARRLGEMGIAWSPCGTVAPALAEKYAALGYPGVTRSMGVVATVGSGDRCFLLRADMDALPIVEENDLPFRSERPCSHMCGHDAHAAMLLGAAALLKKHEGELPGTVKLMFQPGEEMGYGSQTMIDDGVLEHPHVDAAFALHVMATEPVGSVSYAPGVTSSSLDTVAVTVRGRGGHTSAPQQCVDPVMVANQVYGAVNLLMTREVDPAAHITLSCGAFNAGTVPNALPDTAELKIGLRSFDVEARAHVLKRLPELVEGYVRAWRADCSLATFSCPCTYTNPELAAELLPAFEAVAGAEHVRESGPMPATEDFSYVSEAVPSVYAVLGAGGPDHAPHHNPHMQLDESVLWMGAALHAACAVMWLGRRAAW